MMAISKSAAFLGLLAGVLLAAPYPAAQTLPETVAVVTDTTGEVTDLGSLSSGEEYFAAFDVGGSGLVLVLKEYRVPYYGHTEGTHSLFVKFSQMKEITRIKKGIFKVALSDGTSLECGIEDNAFIKGRCSLGMLTLTFDKIQSLRIIACKPVVIPPQPGAKGRIILRDGRVIESGNINAYYYVPSRYINVSGDHKFSQTLWMETKKGAAVLEISMPFSDVGTVVFDKVKAAADKSSYSTGESVSVTLKNGTVLSGRVFDVSYRDKSFGTLCGTSGDYLFRINGLGWVVDTVHFSDSSPAK